MITTQAWVLKAGPRTRRGETVPGVLEKETITLEPPGPGELLAEPLFGSWEGNMTHALLRDPVDICRLRHEPQVVLGNSGVVRVLEAGPGTERTAGEICVLVPAGEIDEHGFVNTVLGFDAPGTMGMLSRKVVLRQDQVLPVPTDTHLSLEQWACLSIRYATAWASWEAAFGCWRVFMSEKDFPRPYVWGWGGGTALAQLELARRHGCHVAMMCSSDQRAATLREAGITPVDRRHFPDIAWDEDLAGDRKFKIRHRKSMAAFLEIVTELTEGHGVSIFIENIGAPVFPATLKALGRPGILSTVGWKEGHRVSCYRPEECMRRHVHVHTHAMRMTQMRAAFRFVEEEAWAPPPPETVYDWDDIPRLAANFEAGRIDTYFPVYGVNPP